MSLVLSPQGRRYGKLPDRPRSPKDFSLANAPINYGALPLSVNLSSFLGDVKDQGDEGSCTGHAYSEDREFLARKFQNESPTLSPQSLYVMELQNEGTFPDDNGAMPVTGCVILNAQGCNELSDWPYVAGQIVAPTPDQLAKALKWKSGAYHRLNAFSDVLWCLASGYCTPYGFNVYQSFESDQVANTGIVPIPDTSKDMLLGGHMVLAYGYDLTGSALDNPWPGTVGVYTRNSWGSSWGKNGNFIIPLAFAHNPNLVTDYYLSHLGRAWGK